MQQPKKIKPLIPSCFLARETDLYRFFFFF